MALIKSVRDEEERKRKQQAQANQTAQTAANKSAQMNSDAAKRNSAGASKAPTQSAADTIKAAKEKAKTGTVTKTPKQYANSAQYVKKSNPVRQTFNYETLGTQERVDQVASWIVDPKEKQGFLDGWTAYTNTKSYKNQQKRKEQLQGLNGLYDANGRPINVNTASYSTVVQGIRSIADATKRKEAAAKLEEMTKTWGSRFYGQTYTKDIVTSYLGNPSFTEDTYKESVKSYANAFYAQSGYEEHNAQQYLSFYNAIQDGAYTDSVKRQLKEALDASWQNTTGNQAPSVEAVAAANAAVNAAQNAAETQGEEDKPNVLEQAWSAVTGWFKGEETSSEEAKEGVPTEDKNSVGEAVGKFISGEWVMDPEWVEEYEQREETPKISQEPGFTGMYASATVSDVPIVKPGQQKQYIEVKDDADVLRAYYAGKLDQVSDADKRGFLSLIQNQYAKQVLGLVTDEESAKAALIGNEGAEMVGLSNLTSLGVKFYDAYSMINSESFPDELRDDGMLMLLNLTKRAALLEEQGALGGDEYLPAMERLLTTDKWAQAELEKLYGARDALIANKNGILTAQQRETDKAIQEARDAFIRNDASAEQIELVYASVPSDAPKKAYKDKTYKAMKADINYWDSGYFDEDGGAFYNGALYANLPKEDMESLDDYKLGLSSKMMEMLQLDARAAASLGMSLEDFYSRVGGMTSETLANRASAQMVREAKSVTQEDAVAFDEIKNDSSIGWFATGVLSVSHGTLSAYEAYNDTLYMGVTEGNVIRTGEKMKIKYEQEYGAEGRETYRAEMQDYIDSGLLDEDYAKALQHALDNVGDVYSIGIDPEDADGPIVRNGAWARRNLKMQDAYVTENGSEAEQEAFRLLSSSVNNAWQMAVSYAATMGAGAALGGAAATAKGLEKAGKIAQKIGFAYGYGRGQWSESVEKRMAEGFDRNTAVWLGSLDTYGSYKANFMTFGNVLTRATGMDSLAGKAMDWLFKNPIGALKGQATVRSFVSGVFAGVENVAEEVGDTFKEGLYQKGIDKWLVPVFQKANNGEDVRASDYLMATLQAFKPSEIAKYAAESAAETVNSAPEIAIQTSLFALAGAAGNAFNTYKGYRTAQGMPIKSEGLAGFDSVQMATDIVNGRSNDVAGFLDALKADCEDNRFIALFNEAAETSGLAHKTIMNLIRANGRDAQVKEIEAKNEQIAAHKEKAANSQNAINTAVQSLNEAQNKIDNGTATDEDVQVVIDSTESIAKNKNGLDEANREAAQKEAEVKALQDEGMQEARAKAKRQQGAEEARMREVLLANKKAAIEDKMQRLQEADDALNEAIQNGADDETLEELSTQVQELDKQLGVLNGEIVETDEEVEMETPESEEESAQLEAYQQKELAQQEANDMKSVYSKLAKTAVYVDESQRANILAATGLKTLGQVNRKFGLNLKSEKGKASVSLDGSFFKDVAELAPGRIDAETAHPEEELIRIVERKKELKGMQASVGETAYEKYLPDGEFSATQDPIMQQIASQIYKRTGVEVVVAPLSGNVRALYDRANGRIVLSNKIGAGESMRKAAMHELTHYIEGSVGYASFKKAVLDAAYKRDNDGKMREADVKRIQETYSKAGVELDEAGIEKELVAEATEKIINDPDGRIVQEILDSGDRGVLLRVKNKIEQFLARHKAKKAGNVDAYDAMRNAQKKLAEALKSAGKWVADAAADIDPTIGLESEQAQFAIVQDQSGWPMVKADREISLSEDPNKWNDEIQKHIQDTIRKNGDVAVKTLDGDIVHITKDSQWHAGSWPDNFSKEKYRVKINASAHLDEVSAVSYDQHPDKANKPDDGRHPQVAPDGWRYRTAVYEDYNGQQYWIGFSVGENGNVKTVYNIGKVKKASGENKKTPNSVVGSGVGVSSLGTSLAENASMSSGDDFSVADDGADVNSYTMLDGMQYSLAPNQFANETAQKLNTLSEETKAVLAGRGHEAVADSERMDEAWMTVKERGRDNLINELLDKPVSAWTPQDHVNAALCGVLAEDAGDLHAAAKIILKYDEAGTVAGQTLHVRNIIKRMSPEGALVETIKSANRTNVQHGIPANSIPFGEDPPKTKVDETDASGKRRKTPEKVAKIYDEATRLMNQMANLGGKVSYNNPWGLPLSEKQMALIKAFKLEHTKLAGTAYNVATIKQRQLAAIIAVNNEVEGSGLETVVQQLVAMDNGMAVVTSADMHYIRSQMSEFKAIEGADSSEPLTQAGKNALGRAWQAQDNVNIAGDMSKWSALRYANMLSSTATWTRNIASNMINKGLEGTAKRVAVGIDKSVAKKTGTRTVDVATKEERKAGKEAFSKEVAQTFVDYFVTHTDTGHGRKYGPSHTGRVFQSEFLETYRNLVDFAMQIGDRPFYEQCYTEELAIVKRLGMKKTEMDTDGTVVTRPMTEAEMKEEAVARAVKRVFQEDGAIIDALNGIRGKYPTADLVLSTLLPFVKTPTNVAMRAIDYSPAGLAITIARRGLAGIDTGKVGSISQHDYVMNMGRGLTGTGLMLAGWALASAGLIGFGRGEEENKKRRNVLAALGEPYSMYIDIAGTKHEIDWALPMAASIAAGANFYKLREEGDGLMEAAFSAVLSGVGDQLFSTPMLSSMQEIFQGYDDTTDTLTRVLSTSTTSLLNQTFSPAILRAIAKYTDPYVRDTSDSNPVWQVIKQNVVQYYPVLRNMLPAKTDLTGDDTLQTDFYNLGQEYQNAAMRFLDSFFTPTATIGEKNDPELLALLELSRRANTTICLPEMLIGTKDYELEVTASYAKALGYKVDNKGIPYTINLTDGEKYRINQEYGDLLFNGSGTTKYIDASGKYVPVVGIRELMNSATWKAKEPDEQAKDIETKIKEVKLLIMKKYTDEKKKNGEL